MENFGAINETFIEILTRGLVKEDSKNKNLFKTYIRELKKNPVLLTQYKVYEAIENKVEPNEGKSAIYIKECLDILNGLGKDKIIKENQKLVSLLNKNGYKVIKGNYPNKELYESISKLIGTNKSIKNLDVITESISNLTNYIMNNTPKTTKKDVGKFYDSKLYASSMAKAFNEKYDHLTAKQKEVIRKSRYGTIEEKEETFKEIIIECLDLVNGHLNEECSIEEKDKLLQVKDKLLRYKFDNDEFLSESLKMLELKNTL